MNYAGFRHGEAQEVAAALEGDQGPDATALTLALANALRRIHALERRVGPLRKNCDSPNCPAHGDGPCAACEGRF